MDAFISVHPRTVAARPFNFKPNMADIALAFREVEGGINRPGDPYWCLAHLSSFLIHSVFRSMLDVLRSL